MRIVAIIPARYASERLPGKPIRSEIKERTGKFLIEHVYDRVKASRMMTDVIVATDDERILSAVSSFGGKAIMTSSKHKCGTDRIAEVAAKLDADIIVNVQGDEPEIQAALVESVAGMLLKDPDASMSTLATEITDEAELENPAVVKVVLDNRGYALYFSRWPIPYVRDSAKPLKWSSVRFLRHLGIYGYRRDFLLHYVTLPPSPLEEAEKLEQLRALANGFKIKVGITDHHCIGIDTPEDMERFCRRVEAKRDPSSQA